MATTRLIRQPDRRLTGQKLAPRPSALIGPPGALARPAMAAAAARAVLEAGAAPPPLLPPPRGPGRPPRARRSCSSRSYSSPRFPRVVPSPPSVRGVKASPARRAELHRLTWGRPPRHGIGVGRGTWGRRVRIRILTLK